MVAKTRPNSTYVYYPNMMDRLASHHNTAPGTLVRTTQPHGCPKNNTMGHSYVELLATGKFIGLVHNNSLHTRQEYAAARQDRPELPEIVVA